MTIEMQEALNRELEDAKAIKDTDLRRDAMEIVQSHMLAALIDCQRKTAERVKQLVASAEAQRNRVAGAKALWMLLRYVAAAGGGAAVLKLLSVLH